MPKRDFYSIAKKNQIDTNIIDTLVSGKRFLILGHKDPDADCLGSMVAFALLVKKLGKYAEIYLPDMFLAQLNYLTAICDYNGITLIRKVGMPLGEYSAVIILDTPKPSMLMANDEIRAFIANPGIRKIEMDHHLGSDSAEMGDEMFRLYSRAASSCELVGYFSLKLASWYEASGEGQRNDIFSRNLALCILTGIVGDTGMGKYLRLERQKWYYKVFSGLYSQLLDKTTDKSRGNISTMQDIYSLLLNLSDQEAACLYEMEIFMEKGHSVYSIGLDRRVSALFFNRYPNEVIVDVAKSEANTLAEDSGRMGLVAYYDAPLISDFVQFRLRRSSSWEKLDLRLVLDALGITNGGGHEGAVGFRVPKADIPDLSVYMQKLLANIELVASQDREPESRR
jgi:nanoRNase/pAp phosphatase (c-di-AMP/oligoRNAs hydrolase)